MKNKKTDMPYDSEIDCHAVIHSAAVATGALGAIPIPVADALPISAVQIAMIISLGKVFGLPVSRAVAEQIAGVGLAVTGGRFIASNIIKAIPLAGQIAGPIVGAATAVSITEALGWLAADDFYRISVGEKPEKIGKAAKDLAGFFSKIK